MEEHTTLAFTFAADLAKQVMTLSTGVIALTIAFLKDLKLRAPSGAIRWLRWSWFLYIISLIAGVWTLMGLTGQLEQWGRLITYTRFGMNIRLPAGIQILAFLLATISVIVFASKVIAHPEQRD